MILKRIEAENILRYRRLLLTDLPARGQIAVAGANEAGKTAIGETICFGLFGRTFSLGPEELEKVIRWGEYRASVTLEFSGADGGDYTVVRSIDNTGKHTARLYLAGERDPLAEGTAQVADAIRELGGFTYKSFIDSFYLAQREMEVPHGKSATVRALIGVDRLEAVADELKTERAETAAALGVTEAETHTRRQEIAEINFDRAQLGRLEAARSAKAEAAAATEAESAELSARAELIGRAATSLVDAARMFVESTCETSYGQWHDRKELVATSLAAATTASQYSSFDAQSPACETAQVALEAFEDGLAAYAKVHDLADLYRQRLATLLDDNPMRDTRIEPDQRRGGRGDVCFGDRRAEVLTRISRVTRYTRPLLVFGVLCAGGALSAWVGWSALRAAPESALAGWLQQVISLGESGRQLLLLLGAVGGSALTGLAFALYLQALNALRACHRKLEDIDTQAQIARVEIDVINRMDEAALPDALEALRGVRNDLLNSAVVSFARGDGAVLVRPDALAAKLAEVRDGGDRAAESLRRTQRRVSEGAAELKTQATGLRAEVARLEAEIAEERARWERVEALERGVAALEARASELRDDIVVHDVAGALIDGACRRIYARFHPELRRVVSKILPQLTDDRYEHLELDDDLRVRVYCKEKNDFVGLSEISNGAHRQLMLCVRLALSQALIASSSKAAQFIFFDEPFAFFDEHRMAKAIDVLRKISPQLTQVWLAAQKFDDPSAFEMVLNCAVDRDCLEASGNDVSGAEAIPIRPVFARSG